jgi:hypothetical protein
MIAGIYSKSVNKLNKFLKIEISLLLCTLLSFGIAYSLRLKVDNPNYLEDTKDLIHETSEYKEGLRPWAKEGFEKLSIEEKKQLLNDYEITQQKRIKSGEQLLNNLAVVNSFPNESYFLIAMLAMGLFGGLALLFPIIYFIYKKVRSKS